MSVINQVRKYQCGIFLKILNENVPAASLCIYEKYMCLPRVTFGLNSLYYEKIKKYFLVLFLGYDCPFFFFCVDDISFPNSLIW